MPLTRKVLRAKARIDLAVSMGYPLNLNDSVKKQMLSEPERRVLFVLAVKFITGHTLRHSLDLLVRFVSRQNERRQVFAKDAAEKIKERFL